MNVDNVQEKRLVVGVSGSTCSGKTTLVALLKNLFPNSKVFNQDQYYFLEDDPR
jgi:uridine kinase